MPPQSASDQDIDRLASGLAACLPALARALERHVDQHYPHPKPSDAQLTLLRYVETNSGTTVREAARAVRMKPNNVSALVTQLTEQGLLERRQDPADRRIAHLHLTPAAQRRLGEVKQLMGDRAAQVLRTMTDGELDALGSALGSLQSLTERLHTSH
ncbi:MULTISPECIES: MarR family winged helix-turn-helix transcriptional regulator [Streptomyces]|uniref:MarR family winged helix-turn-helix transcriptional regulator n=1 Tax=Streptomyces TaxID=1883 RepID=UPI00190419FE|nr:MarR family transcriptional regulator [Streptomyces sp. NE5-10]GHJ96353.1 MarR family transcriptional regulator [Streptomyces sp. NE5-10]